MKQLFDFQICAVNTVHICCIIAMQTWQMKIEYEYRREQREERIQEFG